MYRAWCFTLNNYTSVEVSALAAVKCKYMIYGKEVGENQTPHLQGYVRFSSPAKFDTVKKKLGDRVHLEPAKGNPEQNIEYCSKEGDVTERGERPKTQSEKGAAGKQYWTDLKSKAKEGKIDEVDDKAYIQHYRTLSAIAKDHAVNQPSVDSTTGEWWVGPSGSGKSRKARETYPDAYIKGVNKWWDGYKGQETVIIEDIDKFNVSLGGDLKRWCDHYSFPAEVKGGGLNIRPKRIIITSQYEIDGIWEDAETVDALMRRCKRRKFPE